MLVNTAKQRRAEGLKGAEAHVVIRRRLRGAQAPGELQRPRPGDILPRLFRQPRQDQMG
jgi:hypothetical protein